MKENKIMVSLAEFGRISGVGVQSLRVLAKRGDLPGIFVGRKFLVHTEEALGYLRRAAVGAVADDGTATV